MMFSCRALLGPLALIVCAAALPAAAGQESPVRPEDPQIAAARAKYRADQWPRGLRRTGLSLGTLRLADLNGDELEVRPDGSLARTWRGEGERAAARVRIELLVADSVDQSQRQLLGTLAFVSSPRELPTLASLGLDAGDVGYAGPSGSGPGRLSWAAFAEGNLAVRISDVNLRGPDPDLRAVVGQVAQAVRSAPTLAEGAPLPRPTIERFEVERRQCQAGETLSLDFAVADPASEPDLVAWRISGTAQGYVEDDDSGRPALVTTGSGLLRLTLVAVSSGGTTARSTVEIEVLPD